MGGFYRGKNTLVGDKVLLTDKKAYEFYKKHQMFRDAKVVDSQKKYAKILNALYKSIRKSAIEYEGGVYDKTYFYIIPQPCFTRQRLSPTKTSEGRDFTMNLHSNGYAYTLLFCNLLQTKTAFFYEISKTFNDKFKSLFSTFMFKHSPKYLFSLSTLKS